MCDAPHLMIIHQRAQMPRPSFALHHMHAHQTVHLQIRKSTPVRVDYYVSNLGLVQRFAGTYYRWTTRPSLI